MIASLTFFPRTGVDALLLLQLALHLEESAASMRVVTSFAANLAQLSTCIDRNMGEAEEDWWLWHMGDRGSRMSTLSGATAEVHA